MKSLVISLSILLSVIATSVFGAIYTDKKLESFEIDIERYVPEHETDLAVILRGAEKIEDEYKHLEKYLILFIHDNGISEIEEHVSDIKSAAKSGELADAMIAKSRLTLHIKQLRRLSGFSPEAIL